MVPGPPSCLIVGANGTVPNLIRRKGSSVQHDPIGPASESGELDPDGWLWVRGVDYVAGWRDATNAAADLTDALSSAGIDTAELATRADTDADGSGVLHLRLPALVAQEVARLLRATERIDGLW
jgi:hypothetical protein